MGDDSGVLVMMATTRALAVAVATGSAAAAVVMVAVRRRRQTAAVRSCTTAAVSPVTGVCQRTAATASERTQVQRAQVHRPACWPACVRITLLLLRSATAMTHSLPAVSPVPAPTTATVLRRSPVGPRLVLFCRRKQGREGGRELRRTSRPEPTLSSSNQQQKLRWGLPPFGCCSRLCSLRSAAAPPASAQRGPHSAVRTV